jgi:protein-S-isoprenylcysteine O-methyltransferase Ste14
MLRGLRLVGWLACVVYATIPAFWLMIHPFADRWRARDRSVRQSPYAALLPLWVAMWIVGAVATRPWRDIILYRQNWTWVAASLLFGCGVYLYLESAKNFSGRQLAGVPEVHSSETEQFLATGGIRSRVRHPIYLAHLCEMLGWSIGTGLAVCWGLTVLGVVTGAVMIRMEDAELEKRFGKDYLEYRRRVPALLPRLRNFRAKAP